MSFSRGEVLKVVVVAALTAGAMIPIACRRSRNTELPVELHGRWTTTDLRYKGCYFELSSSGPMRVGAGDGKEAIYTIWDVEAEPEDAFIRYKVTYLNADAQEYEFHFYYDSLDGGIIRFINQELKWKRTGE